MVGSPTPHPRVVRFVDEEHGRMAKALFARIVGMRAD
jgi:hypothetical protein